MSNRHTKYLSPRPIAFGDFYSFHCWNTLSSTHDKKPWNDSSTTSCKEHPCYVSSTLAQCFKRWDFLKNVVDARQYVITIAHPEHLVQLNQKQMNKEYHYLERYNCTSAMMCCNFCWGVKTDFSMPRFSNLTS